MEIVPVEVKGGEDKSAPSFKKYVQEKEPKTALRFSKEDIGKMEMSRMCRCIWQGK